MPSDDATGVDQSLCVIEGQPINRPSSPRSSILKPPHILVTIMVHLTVYHPKGPHPPPTVVNFNLNFRVQIQCTVSSETERDVGLAKQPLV